MTAELAHRAAAGDRDPVVLDWITDAMRRHLAGDDLEHALGLDRTSRLRERNEALQAAADLLDDGNGPWRTACRLQAAIRRYEARIRPLLDRDPTMSLPPIDQALRRACSAGRVPKTARNIYELIR